MEQIVLNPLRGNDQTKRLSPETHSLAWRYLSGSLQKRMQDAGFLLSDLNLPDNTPPEIRHGKNTILTAGRSVIEILPEERLAGNASNIQALRHCIPGYAPSGWGGAGSSISHTTVDFGDAVRKGLKGLETEILDHLASDTDIHHQDFYNGLLDVIKAMRIWTSRLRETYQNMLQQSEYAAYLQNLQAVLDRLQKVPEEPPETFAEAIQSFWSFFEFQRLCGNWPGLGRFDEILGPYLETDLKNGIITLDEARELIAHFWIKGSEWCFGLLKTTSRTPGSGDAQYYQNIILSGIDRAGNHIENEVTFLVLDVIEELHISDFPVTVRLNEHTSEKLLQRIADVQLLGGGIVSVYNEPEILHGLTEVLGFSPEEARTFTNDGCWEIILPGQTHFGYIPLDFLLPFQEVLFADKTPENLDELYALYLKQVRELIERTRETTIKALCYPGKNAPGDYPSKPVAHADVVLSLLEPSCRESGCSYTLHGTRFVFKAIHMAGLPDVANSLYAIRKYVFEEKLLTLPELVQILKNDWQDAEPLRLHFANSLKYYGNDNPEVDELLKQIVHDCSAIIKERPEVGYIMTPAGVSTFGREAAYAEYRMATAYGKHAHEFLAPNLSPTPGTEKSSITAILNSYCRMDFSDTPNGCPLDLRLSAGIRNVANASVHLAQVLRAFVKMKGLYMQIDAVDLETLLAAKKDPDRFPNLVVRISGWSARFASLNSQWQDLIINRTAREKL